MTEDGPLNNDELDAALEAVFAARGEGETVLAMIERVTGAQSRILLRDTPGDASPVVTVSSGAAGAAPLETGRYQVLGEIGRGAVGVVYQGRDRDLGRDVALKVLRPELRDRPEIVQRFVEEAQIEGQLQHPGIVPLYGLGLNADGCPYFAMKLVKGQTLARILARRESPAEDRQKLVGLFHRVAQTVAYAHSRDVVHRDLKPGNVMVGAFGEVQVVDWGFAKVLGQRRAGETGPRPVDVTLVATIRSGEDGSTSVAGSVMGTPAYMPPEQALGRVDDLDARADVFSLGAILTEVLTGCPPYVGDAAELVVMAAQCRQEDAHARLDACGAAPDLVALAKRCLAPLRRDRPADAGVVAEAVEAFLAGEEDRVRRAEVEAARERTLAEEDRARLAEEELAERRARSAALEAKERADAARAEERRAKRRAAWERAARGRTRLLAAAVLLAVAVGSGLFLWRRAESAARTDRANEVVAAALDEAAAHLGRGDVSGAIATARRAEGLARGAGADEDARARVRATLASLAEAERAEARRAVEGELLARMDEARFLRQDRYRQQEYALADAELDEGLLAAFSAAGIDLRGSTPEESARRVREFERGPEILAGLDEWIDLRDGKENELGRRLVAIVSALDPDEARERLRRAIREGDLATLRGIADRTDPETAPIRDLYRLGDGLVDAGDHARGKKLLLAALRRAPANPVLLDRLGRATYSEDAPDPVWRLAAYVAALATRPESAGTYSAAAWRLEGVGDLDRAIALYRRAVELAPDRFLWRLQLCSWLTTAGREEEVRREAEVAVAQIRERLAAEPDSATLREKLGRALSRLGREEEAVVAYREAAELADDPAQILNNLAMSLLRLGRHDEAVATLRKVTGLDTTDYYRWWAWARLGPILWGRGDRAGTADAYREAVALRPTDAESWRGLGNSLSQLGDDAGAETALRRAVRLAPTDVDAASDLGAFLTIRGRPEGPTLLERLRARLRAEVARNPDRARPRLLLGRIALLLGDYDGACDALEAALAKTPASSKGWLWLSDARRKLGQWDRALAAVEEALRVRPDGADALRQKADLLMWIRELRRAEAAYRELLALGPQPPDTHLNYASCLILLERPDEALAQVEEALGAGPIPDDIQVRSGHVLADAAGLYLGAGRIEDAARVAERALSFDPGNAKALAVKADVLDRQGRPDKADEWFARAFAADPGSVDAWGLRSNTLWRRGDYEECVRAREKLVASAPENLRAWVALAEARLFAGDGEGAVAAGTRAFELDPTDPEAARFVAIGLYREERLKSALHRLESVSGLSGLGRLFLLRLRRLTGDVSGALRDAEALAEDFPESSSAHLERAFAAAILEDWATAEESLARSLELDPEAAESHRVMAEVLAATGRPREALEHVERARAGRWPPGMSAEDYAPSLARLTRLAALAPRLAEIRAGERKPASASEALDFAWLCLGGGDPGAASDWFERAFATDPSLRGLQDKDDPILEAAKAAARAGREERAKTLLAEALVRYRRWCTEPPEGRSGEQVRYLIRQELGHLLAAPSWSKFRDPWELMDRPAEEAEPWEKLWRLAEDLLDELSEWTR